MDFGRCLSGRDVQFLFLDVTPRNTAETLPKEGVAQTWARVPLEVPAYQRPFLWAALAAYLLSITLRLL